MALQRRLLTQFDYLLFGAAVSLALLGVLGVYSATTQQGDSSIYMRQLIWVGLGVAVCLLVLWLDYHFLVDHAFFLYTTTVFVLVAVLLFGETINGSKSWISYGPFRFQPSEMAKVVVILAVARYLAELSENFLQRRHLVAVLGIVIGPMVLITLQGDLGSAIVLLPIALGILMVAGLRFRVIAVLCLAALLLAPVGWYSLEDYQRQRILTTLDPSLDPQGVGYQARQSQIAVGSGGLIGKGIGNGLQSRLGFVPESHTDFIFALLAEETGFLGGSFILLLYLLVLMRLISIGEQARDRAGILILSGIASLVFFHVVVNVGMALGVVPPIGIPLPLLSYGGSSTVTIFVAIGLALNVYMRRFVYS